MRIIRKLKLSPLFIISIFGIMLLVLVGISSLQNNPELSYREKGVSMQVLAAKNNLSANLESDNAAFSFSYPTQATIKQSKGDMVTYEVSTDTDIKYEMIKKGKGQGIKETIILKNSKAPHEFSFDVNLDNVSSFSPDPTDRTWHFYNDEGKEAFRIPAGFMVDAKGEKSENVDISIEENGDSHTLVVTADSSWLQEEERAYPVSIDPSVILSGGFTEVEAKRGGQQRKIVYVNSNWYAFYSDASTVFYKKSSDGSTWGSAVTVDSTSAPFAPTVWLEGDLIYVAWIRDTTDAIAVNTIDTASSDALGTQCTTGDLGDYSASNTPDFPSLAVADNGTVYIAGTGGSVATVQKLTFSGCTFIDITAGSGLTTADVPAITTIGNNLHMVFQSGVIAHSVYNGSSWVIMGGGYIESAARAGGIQRKIVYVNSNWYAFYKDEGVYYKKSADGSTWSNGVQVATNLSSIPPSVWVEGNLIYVAWIGSHSIIVETIDTASSDTQGTICQSSSFGSTAGSDIVSIAVADDGNVYVVWNRHVALFKLDYSTCTFTSISTGSGLNANDEFTILTIGNNLHIVFQDGDLSHSIYDGSSWTTSNTTIDADTDTVFSLTTDDTNLWLLTVDSTTVSAFYKCTSCSSSSNWSTETSPWPSGETNLTSVSLTYDSANSDLYALAIKDTTEQAYFKSTDAGTISWGSETSFGFSGGDLGQISSPLESAGISQIGVTLRNSNDYMFSNLTPTTSTILDLTMVDADSDSTYSLTTDGSNLWLLTVDFSSSTAFYKCTSCSSSSNWSIETSPWPSGETNLTSVSLTYDSANSDFYAFVIKDASEQAYWKSSDATTISWSGETSLAFTAGDLGHISSELTGPPVSAVARQGANFEFANVLVAPTPTPTLTPTPTPGPKVEIKGGTQFRGGSKIQ